MGRKVVRGGGTGAVREANVLLEVSSESGDQWPEIRWCHSFLNTYHHYFLNTYCVPAAGLRGRYRDE